MRKSWIVMALVSLLMHQISAWGGESVYRTIADGTVIEAQIDKARAPYRFKVRVSKDFGIERIEVYRPSGKKLQSLKFPEGAEAPCSDCDLLQFLDLNFDGFKDMLILVGWGSGGSMYEPYIFNPKKMAFETAKVKEVLENPTLDNEKKMVVTDSHMGCCAGTISYYKVKGNVFRLVKEETFPAEDDNQKR